MSDISWIVHPRGAPLTAQVTIVAESETGIAALADLSLMPIAALDSLSALAVLAELKRRDVRVHCCASN